MTYAMVSPQETPLEYHFTYFPDHKIDSDQHILYRILQNLDRALCRCLSAETSLAGRLTHILKKSGYSVSSLERDFPVFRIHLDRELDPSTTRRLRHLFRVTP